MKVNIYYGGRGLIDDPTIYVMDKLTEVLKEIRVEVVRYNLYEEKNSIAMLPKTLKEAEGIILATTVEWLGIGGLMTQFLDACWLYADKEHIGDLYMMPVVLSNTLGEKEAMITLTKAWDILGGKPCDGICAYVEDHVEFETNTDYSTIIEKKAENLYRTIKQKMKFFPTSSGCVQKDVLHNNLDLTPQESEQLSMYVSDDTYVKKQKEDIEELTLMFKGMLSETSNDSRPEFIEELKKAFRPKDGLRVSYEITMTDMKKTLVIDIVDKDLNCFYGTKRSANIIVNTTYDVVEKIVNGHISFQRAFMSGALTAKGDFQGIKSFDDLFQFEE